MRAGATSSGPDEVVIRLVADEAYEVELEQVAVGRDMPPGLATTLEVVDEHAERLDDGRLSVTLDFVLRSDRAREAVVSVEGVEPQLNYTPDGAESTLVRLQDGVASGSLAFVTPSTGSNSVSGFVVARTNGFNSPSVAFSAEERRQFVPSNLRYLMIFLGLLLLLFGLVRLMLGAIGQPTLESLITVAAITMNPAWIIAYAIRHHLNPSTGWFIPMLVAAATFAALSTAAFWPSLKMLISLELPAYRRWSTAILAWSAAGFVCAFIWFGYETVLDAYGVGIAFAFILLPFPALGYLAARGRYEPRMTRSCGERANAPADELAQPPADS